MATSSERSPPPFPDSGDVAGRGSDEDDADELFMSVNNSSLSETPSASQPSDELITPSSDTATDPISSGSGSKTPSERSDEIEDNWMSPSVSVGSKGEEKAFGQNPLNDDFVDILGSETEPQQEIVTGDVSESQPPDVDDSKEEVKETAPLLDIGLSEDPAPHPVNKVADPLADFFDDPPPVTSQKQSSAAADLFEDEGSDLFADPLAIKPAKPPQKSLFDEPDEDIFGETTGAKKDEPLAEKSPSGAPQPDRDQGDIFKEEAIPPSNTSRINSKTNGVHVEESTDIFADATVELSLDSPQNERKKEPAAKPSMSTPVVSNVAAVAKPSPPSAVLEELDEEEESELEDKFDINIAISDPEKIGDGMTAYMAYKVSTQTTMSMFRNKTFTVRRRFSDFLGLYEKLSEKHGPNGFIVPPPPEKSILGMTKVKVGKEDSSSADFLERRRGALERYLQRVVTHPSLIQDPDVREFLERDELPRAVSTQALSGAGFLKMINKATDAVSKMTIKMNESDVWFEDKLQEVESADQHFRKLHALVESLVVHRKELSANTASFAKSAAMLGSAEDNTALSRALSQLAEVEDKMEQLHHDQAANDTFGFAELIADFIRLLGAVRSSFDQRMKAWQRWQDAQSALQKRRETEAKLQWANKPDKLQQAKEEIVEWEAKVTQYEQDFDRVSATVRKEVLRFEKEKARNFKRQIIKYLENLLKSQQQLIKYWEAFLPEAKAIA
ncbi:sorting nexin-1a [Corythoichthys intestinalis]|uniref:sorting nexin-1a n=1 Tax=Corythoichthys intestinalis TaxID=161448 RepID=UPI0025A51BF4|nr:sorting nexin-1a [Corythoichthys intestinalis]XP_061812643.1 sorting nexin-1-like [Nerophis lumbriciformis]